MKTGQPQVVGVNSGPFPFGYLSYDEVVGSDVELLARFAERENRALRVIDVTFSGLISALSSGKVDVVAASLSLTEERKNILHAYPKKMGEEAAICMAMKGKSLIFTIADRGLEFDPTQVPNADITISAEERQIGGLGIFLIRKIMDEMSYRRIGTKNILI